MDYPFLCVICNIFHSYFLKHCLWLLNLYNGINIFHLQCNGFLYVGKNNTSFGLYFSGWVQSKPDFKVVVFKVGLFPHWEQLGFTKIHKGTEPKSWTPTEIYCNCKIQYCTNFMLIFSLIPIGRPNFPVSAKWNFVQQSFSIWAQRMQTSVLLAWRHIPQWEQFRNCGRFLS